MARLIDVDELRSDMYEYVFPITTNNLMGAADAYYRILHLLDDAQTVDAVEVVRCKDCRYYNTTNWNKGGGWCEFVDGGRFDNAYCNYGAKMDGGDKE